ncbi:uncharacterized protein LOC124911583 [Impatiens glandulifera]|uniref:uncharacterized protein LOC124911583 n=1 Tax=Impatiens glandulifera TaxID=253017 RepID=UPI001FB097CA|nr:uncharacterized protein LOC124911583 [Impatiens glandulifera]
MAANSESDSELVVEAVKCESCGFTEDCTPAYISRIRENYNGRWICGLCCEAVKDEVLRSDKVDVTTEEALNKHIHFCQDFQHSGHEIHHYHPISAIGRLLCRTLDNYPTHQHQPFPPPPPLRRRRRPFLLPSD